MTADLSNFDKRRSNDHFVCFLFCYCCTTGCTVVTHSISAQTNQEEIKYSKGDKE